MEQTESCVNGSLFPGDLCPRSVRLLQGCVSQEHPYDGWTSFSECPVHSLSVAEHKGQTGQNPQERFTVWMNCHREIEFPNFFLSHCSVWFMWRVWIFCVNRNLRFSVDLQVQLPARAVAAHIHREWFQAYSASSNSMFCPAPRARVCGYRTKHGV